MFFYFSLDGYNMDGLDVFFILDLDFLYDILVFRDFFIFFLCIIDDNDVIYLLDFFGMLIYFLVRYILL